MVGVVFVDHFEVLSGGRSLAGGLLGPGVVGLVGFVPVLLLFVVRLLVVGILEDGCGQYYKTFRHRF